MTEPEDLDRKALHERARELDRAPPLAVETLANVTLASGLLDAAHGCLRLIAGGICTKDGISHSLAHARYLTKQALVVMEPLFKPTRENCGTAWWCPRCPRGVELGEQAQTDLVPTPETKAVCPDCGTELEAA